MNGVLAQKSPLGAAARTLFAVPLACLLASCAPEPSSAPPTARTEAPVVQSISPAPETPAAAVPAPAPVEPPPPAAEPSQAPRLAIDGEGLRFFNATTGSASPIAFGRPQPEVLAAVERARGQATRGVNADCGAGPVDYATWTDGLSLVFQNDRFVGWGLSRRATGITTASGIGPGCTLSAMDDAYGDVAVEKTSLGSEFAAGGFHGVLDGPGAQARITDMWAGVSCVAR